MTTLYVMCGLSGAGKSTHAARLALRGALVLSADTIRTHGEQSKRVFARLYDDAYRNLMGGRDVVLDARSLYSFERARALRLGRSASARCELLMMCTDWRVCRARDLARAAQSHSDWFGAIALFVRATQCARREGWHAVHMISQGETSVAPDVCVHEAPRVAHEPPGLTVGGGRGPTGPDAPDRVKT